MPNFHEVAPSYSEERHAFINALAALVAGLISIFGGFVAIFGFLAGLLGLYFSVLTRASRFNRGMANSALVLSIIGTVLGAIITTWWVIAGIMGYGWTIVMHASWMEVFQ